MFRWKEHNKLWKGPGIYHLTFTTPDRQPLFGKLVMAPPAHVQLSELGFRISEDLQRFGERHPGVKLCAKQIMPDHLHVVLWVYEDSKKSIKELAHGFRKGITNIAVELDVWGKDRAYLPLIETGTAVAQSLSSPAAPLAATPSPAASSPAASSPSAPSPAAPVNSQPAAAGIPALPSPAASVNSAPSAPVNSQPAAAGYLSAAAGIPAARRGFVLSEPYIRTLAHKGQLRSMIDYVHANPYRALAKRMNPELFTLHRETRIADLTFSSMGNHWLLDWPVKQLVQCSRSISASMLEEQLQRCLSAAANGAVSLTAAISKGEQQIARALREAFMPLVILLKDGFPPIGSEYEKYYKPGGVYFEACAKGKLLLLEPSSAAYDAPQVIAATEKALQVKAAAKHVTYVPFPHTSDRWRFMAGNCMLEMMVAI